MRSRKELNPVVRLIVLALLAACTLQTTTPTPQGGTVPTPLQPGEPLEEAGQPTAAATSTPEGVIGPDHFPDGVDPLTGLPVADPALLDRRPVAVKISNYPRSIRPQWGLSLADVVYEYYHNNDLTRFHAIFYGQNADLAGPIRSGRLFDDYLTEIYNSELVFASADYRVRDRLLNKYPSWRMLYILEGECPPRPICRYLPGTYNYLLADTQEVSNYIERVHGDNSRQALDGMSFGPVNMASEKSATRIYVRYSYSAYTYWDYDADTGRYLRYQDTQEDFGGRGAGYELLTDRLTGEAIQADNVVVLYVPHFHFFYQAATATTPAVEVVDMDFTGRGPAVAFRDGEAFELEWVHEDGKVIYLVDGSGQRYNFKPGNTWFQVINDDSKADDDQGTWEFEFIFRRP